MDVSRPRTILMGVLVGTAAALVPLAPLAPSATGAPQRAERVVPCSTGLVSLTFDDGPSPTVTPRLSRLLKREKVPATFFMVGNRVASHPVIARLVADRGFAIGNHSWAHTDMTTQTDAELRSAVRTTRAALVDAGVRPTRLVRPPYGAINDRVRSVLTGMDLKPVLWSIDTRDWAGRTSAQIRASVVSAVRPHRTNLVLLHDGVANSPATLGAMPAMISDLRRRGYCFAALGANGTPIPPVPVASVRADQRRVTEGERAAFTIRLDRPTSRPTTVRVTPGPRVVRFGVGKTVAHRSWRVRQDAVDEHRQRFEVRLGNGSRASVRVIDDDPAPVASLRGTSVQSSPLLATPVAVGVRLDRRSDRDVVVRVRSPLGRITAMVAAGTRRAELALEVPAGEPSDEVREIPVRIVKVIHGTPGADATITVQPPAQNRTQAARAAVAQIRWPRLVVPRLH